MTAPSLLRLVHCIDMDAKTARVHCPKAPECSKSVSNKCIAVRKVATPPRELTGHKGSHSVTCHPAEVTFPLLPQPKLVLD